MLRAAWIMRQPAFVSGSFRLLCCRALGVRYVSVGWQVSSHGRVSTATGRVHYGSLHCSGYRKVVIGNQLYNVHRLVAAAFLGPPPTPSCWQVNHLDGDSENNSLTNLQYVTPAENQRHSWATNPKRQTAAAKLGQAILWRPCGDEAWSFCPSQREAERLLGTPRGSVSNCIRGLARKSCGGGVWYEFKAATATVVERGSPPTEIWRPARYPGAPGIIPNLLVSNHGRVSQAKFGFGTISRGTLLRSGYYVVGRAGNYLLVHRAVAATFFGQPENLEIQVNHKDADRGNNHVNNLEYVTAAQDVQHALQRRSRRHKFGKAVQACYSSSDSSKRPWLDFDSIAAAARHTGVSWGRIDRICRGLGTSASWDFKFAEEKQIPGEVWRTVVLDGVTPDGNAVCYELEGEANAPEVGSRIEARVPCKKKHTQAVPVKNWLHERQRFNVTTELLEPAPDTPQGQGISLQGVGTLDLPPGLEREYRFSVYA
ncbi:unnamed protein product, partial [Symbiodinium microadriaticum]